MTRYIYLLDPVTDRTLLDDGDVFAFTPHITNRCCPRLQVGFCSGVYEVVLPGGVEIAPGYLVADQEYTVTWDADAGKFILGDAETPAPACALTDLADLFGEEGPIDGSYAVTPDEEVGSRVILRVEAATGRIALFSQVDTGSGYGAEVELTLADDTFDAVPWHQDSPSVANPELYEVIFDTSGEDPPYNSTGTFDEYLTLSEDREWVAEGFYDDGYTYASFEGTLTIRLISDPEGCVDSMEFSVAATWNVG